MSTSIAIPAPRRAEKKKVKLKLCLQGPSGSGKTWAALALAFNLWPDAKVCVIDTENDSASLYADFWEFDTIPLAPPFHTDRYIACIDSAIHHGYDVVIIDSLSHQWDGEGGILRRKEELDQRPNSNSYMNWSKFTPEHTRFKEKIVQAPIHIIATMRSKQDYVLETTDKGKSKPVKVGMAPIQREGFDYEFTLMFDIQMDHRALVDKNRTGLFDGEVLNLADKGVADRLRDWQERGKELPPQSPAPGPQLLDGKKGETSKPNAAWKYEQGSLLCHPLDAEKRETKQGAPFVAVKLNGKCEGKHMAFCWYASLFDAVMAAKERDAQFSVEVEGDYLNIIDVIAISGRDYRNGQPYVEPAPVNDSEPLDPAPFEGATDDDIPF